MKEFNSITISKTVGCGKIYCIFNESEDVFDNLIIKGSNAKEALCGEVWMNAMAKILTYALRRSVWEGTTKRAIVKQLLGHRCYASPNKDKTTSCVDAIARCVLEYSKSRDLINEEKEAPKETEAS